jgi:hypothetical protein
MQSAKFGAVSSWTALLFAFFRVIRASFFIAKILDFAGIVWFARAAFVDHRSRVKRGTPSFVFRVFSRDSRIENSAE